MPLPDSFLRELHDRNDILSVVSTYIPLKKRGRTHVGLCPFHGEKTPSFTVYPDTDSFYCFGCGIGGDAITFIKHIENLDYIDAVKLLSDRSGLAMPENERGGYDSERRDLKLRILEANREAARFFYDMLYKPEGSEGLSYLRSSRRLSDGTIRAFGLGFSPDSRKALTDHLMKKGFRPSELIQANLTFQDRGGGYVDRFRNRVMFPIIDVRGNVIAFGGRIMTDEKPKYLNTSDTLAYKKTNNLYALNRAKNSKSDLFILCEGYMDVIALYQAGFDNVVGGLGTALTEEQVRLIGRYRSKVVLCYDSDEAGQKAAMRAIELFDKRDITTNVIRVPDGKDPDEYLKNHPENGFLKFSQLVESADNEVEYFYNNLKQRYNTQTVDGKTQALGEAARFLASLSNPIKRDVYAGKISEDMGIYRQSLDSMINAELRVLHKREKATEERRERQIYSPAPQQQTPGLRAKSLRAGRAEEALIAYLLLYPEMIRVAEEKLTPESFSMPLASKLFALISRREKDSGNISFSSLAPDLSEEESTKLSQIVAKYFEIDQGQPSAALCREYCSVILSEKEKLSADDLSRLSDSEIAEYLARRRKMRKKNNASQS